MALSRLAAQFAAEIKQQYWGDAPYRWDRAGHHYTDDQPEGRTDREKLLNDVEVRKLVSNVMAATAQVLAYNDPNFNIYEYAEACGLTVRNRRGDLDGGIESGLRRDRNGNIDIPGQRNHLAPGTAED